MSKKQNYESHLDALKKSVLALESNQLSLEESIKAFEDGIKHAQKCDDLLKSAEEKIAKLTEKHAIDDAST